MLSTKDVFLWGRGSKVSMRKEKTNEEDELQGGRGGESDLFI
jgi:hypothetical protein